MTLRIFTFKNGVILPCAGYGAEIKAKKTCNGKICWTRLTLTPVTVPSLDFVLKKLMEQSLTLEGGVCHSRFA